jgi:hypothetical protein
MFSPVFSGKSKNKVAADRRAPAVAAVKLRRQSEVA